MCDYPLVSIIAVCYNHARFVVECLDSISNQTYPNMQVIVMDDCSKDDSVKIVRDWIERHKIECVFIVHEQNQGLCRTLNEALALAQGKYVSIVATDDVWLPEKISLQVAALEGASSRAAVAFSDAYTMSEAGALRPGAINDYYRRIWGVIPEGNVYEHLLQGCFVPAPTVMVKRLAYERVGGFDESLDYEDWDMWLRLALQYEFIYIPQPLAKYRLVETSMQATLLDKKSIAKHRTQFRIFSKHVLNARLSESQRREISVSLAKDAEALYELGFMEADRYLSKAVRLTWNRRSILLLACSQLRVPYEKFKSAERRAFKYVDYVKWKFNQITTRV